EEVLFNRAEAYLALGYYDLARADLNTYASKRIEGYDPEAHAITDQKVRNFYNTSDLQLGLLSTLLDFKAAEFVQEGMRWFDILRHDIPVVHFTTEGQMLV